MASAICLLVERAVRVRQRTSWTRNRIPALRREMVSGIRDSSDTIGESAHVLRDVYAQLLTCDRCVRMRGVPRLLGAYTSRPTSSEMDHIGDPSWVRRANPNAGTSNGNRRRAGGVGRSHPIVAHPRISQGISLAIRRTRYACRSAYSFDSAVHRVASCIWIWI